MRKAVTLILIAVIVVVMLVSGCAQPAATPSTPAPTTKTLDIGIATPLTGASSYLGEHIKNAVIMAIDDQNEQGGVTIAGEKYTLNAIDRDTKQNAAVGKTVTEDLVFGSKVKVVIGPFLGDAIGVQSVTEPNKVMMFGVVAALPGLCGPNKPYSFFCGAIPLQHMTSMYTAVQKFYPEAKTVFSIAPDLADGVAFVDAAKTTCPRYGLEWLGVEKFSADITDFMPIISRVLPKNPDVIETSSTGGSLGGLCGLLIKQLREAGFKGIIGVSAPPPLGLIEQMVPKEYMTKIVSLEVNWESPIVAKSYRELAKRYVKKFNITPNAGIVVLFYTATKALFECINGKDTMDTAVWMEEYAKYRWQNPWDRESYWTGKSLFKIDRLLQQYFYVSEYVDGKLETKWESPLADELVIK